MSSVPNESTTRPNPFDDEIFMDERHFEQSYSDVKKEDVLNDELGLAENHFPPEGGHGFGLSKIEELEIAIDTCKDLIHRSEEKSERRKRLVRKLIELRIQLHELKEGPIESSDSSSRSVCGHKFVSQDSGRANRYCERCNSIIWVVLQSWFRCKVCGYSCHEKCLNFLTRTCAGIKVKEGVPLISKICPEKGLAAQKYRCAECRSKLSFTGGKELEPRLCDYSGLYYCYNCHWNDEMVIPARVIHNWDFVPRKVSRYHKQLLKLMARKPTTKIESMNPALCNFIEQLRLIRKMRNDVLLIKCYFLCCKDARQQRLLLQLKKRQHFVDNADVFSMQDLIDINSGQLEIELKEIIDGYLQHIRQDCEVCRGNGFICELCSDKEVIFPFDDYVSICKECWAVFHRLCFEKRRKMCPRCERRRQRKLSEALTEENEEIDTPEDVAKPVSLEVGTLDLSSSGGSNTRSWAEESDESCLRRQKAPPPPPSPDFPIGQFLSRDKQEDAESMVDTGTNNNSNMYDESLNPFAEDV